jgi:hypothetical protein
VVGVTQDEFFAVALNRKLETDAEFLHITSVRSNYMSMDMPLSRPLPLAYTALGLIAH